MKILFVLNTPGFLRYFDAPIDELLVRGHEVSLAFTRPDLRPESLELFAGREVVPVVLGKAPDRDDIFSAVALGIRAAVDYVRYFDPRFEDAEYLRTRRRVRAFELAPWTRALGHRSRLPRRAVGALVRTLLACERALPTSRTVDAFLREVGPDAVLVSPLVTGASPQTDYVKSAKRLGIACGACIASWDNLTNKGLIREVPHAVVVWNEDQRAEAVDLHGVDEHRVIITGAQPFDRWFGRAPSCSSSAFRRKVGLPPDRPFVLFVGSSSNIAREGIEEDFVRRWLDALRENADPTVSSLGVLLRPHPDRPGSWDGMDLEGRHGVTLWPPRKPNSVLPEAREDYFDSLFHSAAVVGINTSAMIEAAVIGRPVLTIATPEFKQSQEGTLHYRYLLPEDGGFVRVAGDLHEHARQLGECVRDPDATRADRERFVRRFIRPHGLERPSTGVLVDAIERLAATRPEVERRPVLLSPLSLLLRLVAVGARGRSAARADSRAARLRERTRRLASIAVRIEQVSPALARPLALAARRHERWAQSRAAAERRREKALHARRKRRARAEKQRGRELLVRGAGKERASR